jgi:hypothetical protein
MLKDLSVVTLSVTLAGPLPAETSQVSGAVIAEHGLYEKAIKEEEFQVDFGESGDEERAMREAYRVRMTEAMEAQGLKATFPEDYLETGLHRIQSAEFQLTQRTDRIPGELGKTFGVRFVLSGGTRPDDEPVDLVYRVDLPEASPAAAKRLEEVAEWTGQAAVGELTWVGWTFEEPWEIVKGEWILRILYRGSQLAEQRFVVE